jgi:GDP-L-fucose synthase
MNLPDSRFQTWLNSAEPPLINIGTGHDLSICELAELVCRGIGFEGKLEFDITKPDGTPQKLLDVSRIHALGWQAQTTLEEGIRRTYDWAKDSIVLTPA